MLRFQTNVPVWTLWVFRLAASTLAVALICTAAFQSSSRRESRPLILQHRVMTARAKLLALSIAPGAANKPLLGAQIVNEPMDVPSAAAFITEASWGTGEPPLVIMDPPILQPEVTEPPRPAYVALCLAVKSDDVDDLRFWISYHQSLGVGKFYIYDDAPVSAAPQLCDFVAQGLVEYTQPPQRLGQLGVYAACLNHPSRQEHRFMGFIDHDEFLVIRDRTAPDLPTLLRRYEGKQGGIGVNWRLFGSSGQDEKPPGPPTHGFWRCVPGSEIQSRHIKSIVGTSEVAGVGGDPHTFRYVPGSYAASTSGRRVDGPLSDVFEDDILVLYHYVTKSRQEYAEKMVRGSGMGNHRQWTFFDEMNALATDDCTDLLDSSPVEVPPAACWHDGPVAV